MILSAAFPLVYNITGKMPRFVTFIFHADKAGKWAGLFFSGVCCVLSALSLYFYVFTQWAPWLTGLLLRIILLVAVLNVYLLITVIKWRRDTEKRLTGLTG